MNKIFKLFSVLTVLLLVMGLSSCIGIFTDGGGSNNGDISSASDFSDFVSSSTTAGVLKDNIIASSYLAVPAGKTKTLDLNGYSITVSYATALAVQGTLSISDSSSNKTGKIISTSESGTAIAVSVLTGGTVTISGGTYAAKDYGIFVSDGGTATITGGKFGYTDGNADNPLIGIGVYANGTSVGTIVNMDCTVYAKEYAVKNAGTITEISGGSYNAKSGATTVIALYNSGTIGSIHGENDDEGNFFGTTTSTAAGSYGYGLYNIGTISSNAGYFEGNPTTGNHAYNYSASTATNTIPSSVTDADDLYSPALASTLPQSN